MRLVADRLEADDTLLQRWVVEIGAAGLDGVVKSLQPQVGLGGALVQLGDVLATALCAFLPAIENGRQNLLEPLRLEQAVGDVLGDEAVELLHRDRAALAAGLALPCFDRAGVVAIPPSLPGPQRHRTAAVGAKADARKEGRAADDARRRDSRISSAKMGLHSVERRLIDQRRHLDRHDLAGGLQFLCLAALGLVVADIGRASQDAVNLSDTPAPAVAGEDTPPVEIVRDVLHAHRTRCAVPFQGQPIDQPHRVGVQRVDLQLLLDLGSALFRRDDAIADGRQRAIPEALPCVLLQGAEDVLGVLPGLVLVEQRHDLPHHDVHRIVAHLLGDGDELDAVLGELADVELQLEVVAEESREAMDDVECCWFARPCLNHTLEFGPAIIGDGRTWLDVGFDEMIAA